MFILVAYFALHSNPIFQIIYISFTALCAATVFWIALEPRINGARAGSWRKDPSSPLSFFPSFIGYR